jgi:hypothetical protein
MVHILIPLTVLYGTFPNVDFREQAVGTMRWGTESSGEPEGSVNERKLATMPCDDLAGDKLGLGR